MTQLMKSTTNNDKGTEVIVYKEEYKIKRNAKSFRVMVPPPNNPKETGVTFHFIPGDYASEIKALKEAIKYRNDTYILGETNTGYRNITVVNDEVRGLIIKVFKTHKHKLINDYFPIDREHSCKDALKEALEFLTSNMDIGMPDTIIYDYALYEAYKRGYEPRDNENKVVSPRLYVGAVIECPKTKREGTVRAIYDDVSVWVSFNEGKPFDTIVNETLYVNKLKEQVNKVENLHDKLLNDDLSDRDKADVYNNISDLGNKMNAMHRQANKNKPLSEDTKEIKKVIHRIKKNVVIKRIRK